MPRIHGRREKNIKHELYISTLKINHPGPSWSVRNHPRHYLVHRALDSIGSIIMTHINELIIFESLALFSFPSLNVLLFLKTKKKSEKINWREKSGRKWQMEICCGFVVEWLTILSSDLFVIRYCRMSRTDSPLTPSHVTIAISMSSIPSQTMSALNQGLF